MAIPKDVEEREQAARAYFEELQKKKAGSAEPPKAEEKAIEVKSEEPPVVTEPPKSEEPLVVAEKKAEEPPVAEDWEAKAKKLEQKYSTLQKKYDAELPRINADAKLLEIELQEMRKKTAELERQNNELALLKRNDVNRQADTDINDAWASIESNVGSEATANLKKLLDLETSKKMALVEEKLGRIDADVSNVSKKSEKMNFDTSIERHVPNWQQINTDPKFIQWIKESVDSIDEETLYDKANRGYKEGNLPVVVNILKAYIKTQKVDDDTQNKEEQIKKKKEKELELESQITPRSSKGGSPPSDNRPDLVKQSDIRNFYAMSRKGEFRGREAEALKLEAYYFKALNEKRVIPE